MPQHETPKEDIPEDRAMASDQEASIRRRLQGRAIVLVGLMGSGKSTIGRRLGTRLDLAFVDSDAEIEDAAGMSISDMFAIYGEAHFREGERRVLDRLTRDGSRVIATGGGAFMDAATRDAIKAHAVSVWLHADLDVLMRRIMRRPTRPLLQNADPEAVMKRLIEERYPVYELADVTVVSNETPHERVVEAVVEALARFLKSQETPV